MMPRFVLILIILISPLGYTQGKSFLKVESGAHTAVISNLMVSSDKKYVVSAAMDKTIRVWDVASGKEARKILGYIGRGHDGAIHATALSADDRYLAVVVHRGESHNKRSNDDARDVIRLYDFNSGELLKVLRPNNTDDVLSISFSEDAKYLISGSEDQSIHVWSMPEVMASATPQPIHTLRDSEYFRRPMDVAIFPHSNDYRIVSVDYSDHLHKIVLYSLDQRKVLQSFSANDRLLSVAVSDRYIAVCGYEHQILVFDLDLNHVKTIATQGRPAGLAFSADGKLLLAGGKETTHDHPITANVFAVDDDFKRLVTYGNHDAESRAVAFLDNATAITGGGTGNEIHFWNAHSGATTKVLAGSGSSVFAVGIKDRKIAFGNTHAYKTDANNYSPLERTFDLEEFVLTKELTADAQMDYRRALTDLQGQRLYIDPDDQWDLFLETGGYDYRAFRSGWYYHEAYGFTDDGLIASGGRGGEVRLYERAPDSYAALERAKLIGHTARVWDLASQGDWLVTGGVDQTIKLWNLATVGSVQSGNYPMLNLFVSNEGEWIVWSKSGYYAASLHGDKYIGYHVNQGEDEPARFYTSDRFLKTLYRPDIIRLIIQTGSEEEALRRANLSSHRIDDILPPNIELLSGSSVSTEQQTTTVKFRVKPQRDSVTRVWMVQNGKFVWSAEGADIANGGEFSESIALLPGDTSLEIFAESRVARSNPVLVSIAVDDSEWQTRGRISDETVVRMKEEKPNLYILAIGVSDYRNAGPSLKNLNYAHKDATDVLSAFKGQDDKAYNDVISKLIVNEAAGKDEIEQGFAWLQAEVEKRETYKKANNVKSDDVSLIFLAGHGVKQGEDFLFLGHDADPANLGLTGVKIMEQGDIMTSLPTELILITDACHSGTIGGGIFQNIDSRELSKRLVALNERAIYIVNASKANKPSLESSTMQQGIFTMVLLEGLQHDGEVYIQPFISFVKRNVRKRTEGAITGAQEPHVVHYGEYEDYLIHRK